MHTHQHTVHYASVTSQNLPKRTIHELGDKLASVLAI